MKTQFRVIIVFGVVFFCISCNSTKKTSLNSPHLSDSMFLYYNCDNIVKLEGVVDNEKYKLKIMNYDTSKIKDILFPEISTDNDSLNLFHIVPKDLLDFKDEFINDSLSKIRYHKLNNKVKYQVILGVFRKRKYIKSDTVLVVSSPTKFNYFYDLELDIEKNNYFIKYDRIYNNRIYIKDCISSNSPFLKLACGPKDLKFCEKCPKDCRYRIQEFEWILKLNDTNILDTEIITNGGLELNNILELITPNNSRNYQLWINVRKVLHANYKGDIEGIDVNYDPLIFIFR